MKNVTLYDLQLLSIHQFFSTCMYVVFCSSSSSSSSIALQGAWLLVFFGTTTGTTRRFCSSSGWFRWAGVMGVMGVMGVGIGGSGVDRVVGGSLRARGFRLALGGRLVVQREGVPSRLLRYGWNA